MARARSAGSGKMLLISASVAGKISAAPTPINARAPISCPEVDTNAASAEVAAKAVSPSARVPRRPNRSLRLPHGSSSPANTRVKG